MSKFYTIHESFGVETTYEENSWTGACTATDGSGRTLSEDGCSGFMRDDKDNGFWK